MVKLRFCLGILIIICFISLANAENEMQWLRNLPVNIEGEDCFLGSSESPNNSPVLEITKTTLEGTHEWVRWYSEPLAVNFQVSGKVLLWFSSMKGNGKFRFALYDYSPSGSSKKIAESEFEEIPQGQQKIETSAEAASSVLAKGNRLKLVIEYSADGGNEISIAVDGPFALTQAAVWKTSNGLSFNAGARDAAAIILNPSEGCPKECSADSECSDADDSTTDFCINAGKCNSSCANLLCTPKCTKDSECSDDRPETTDSCKGTGTCSAYCTNTEKSCSIKCSSNFQCNDSNPGTNDICVSPGTCESECTHSRYVIAEAQECTIACLTNNDCDDKMDTTVDKCVNGGSCSAKCTHDNCSIACYANSGCDDGNPITTDSCLNPGKCNAACSNASCKPMCKTNTECNDKDPSTTDVCSGAGRCAATCIHMKKCGDGKCELSEEETECTCPKDCKTCYLQLPGTCREKNCIGKLCTATITLGCCGNGICELAENYATCAQDCTPKKVDFTLIGYSDAEKYMRGEKVNLVASVAGDGKKLTNAEIYAEGFFGRMKLLNDGKHGDDKAQDNVYGNEFTITDSNKAGSYAITFKVNAAGSERTYAKGFLISDKLDLSLVTNKEFYFQGDNIGISGKIQRKGLDVEVPVKLKITNSAEEVLLDDVLEPVKGAFSYTYKLSTLDKTGIWKIEAYAEDVNKNTASLEKDINILAPGSKISLGVSAKVTKESLERGENAEISVSVHGPDGARTDANVEIEFSGYRIIAERISEGEYRAFAPIGFQSASGPQEIRVYAGKEEGGGIYSGSSSVKINVAKSQISIDVDEPSKRRYAIGETLQIRAKLYYADGKEVTGAIAFAGINGNAINLTEQENGVYYGEYIIDEKDAGLLKVIIEAKDKAFNGGYKEQGVDVSGYSTSYYLRKYGLPAILLLIALSILLAKFGSFAYSRARLSMLRKKEKELTEVIKGLQVQYFKEATLDKKTYNDEIARYEARLSDLRDNIADIEKKRL